MDLTELLHREALASEGQATFNAIMACNDVDLLGKLVLGEATDKSWAYPAWGRLLNMTPEHTAAYAAVLRRVAEQSDNAPIRNAAERRLAELEQATRPVARGKSIFNPDVLRYLALHSSEINLDDERDLDLVEFVVWNNSGEYASGLKRRIAERLYELLPQERRDRVDGKVSGYGWDRSVSEYYVLQRIINREDDADLLEDAALHAESAWVSRFAFARLSGWSTCQEEDWWSFVTFECERLEGYPRERLEQLLNTLVARGRIGPQKAAELLAHAD